MRGCHPFLSTAKGIERNTYKPEASFIDSPCERRLDVQSLHLVLRKHKTDDTFAFSEALPIPPSWGGGSHPYAHNLLSASHCVKIPCY